MYVQLAYTVFKCVSLDVCVRCVCVCVRCVCVCVLCAARSAGIRYRDTPRTFYSALCSRSNPLQMTCQPRTYPHPSDTHKHTYSMLICICMCLCGFVADMANVAVTVFIAVVIAFVVSESACSLRGGAALCRNGQPATKQ